MQLKSEKSRRAPAKEKQFLIDQRTVRMMMIINVDIQLTKKLKKREEKKIKVPTKKKKSHMEVILKLWTEARSEERGTEIAPILSRHLNLLLNI